MTTRAEVLAALEGGAGDDPLVADVADGVVLLRVAGGDVPLVGLPVAGEPAPAEWLREVAEEAEASPLSCRRTDPHEPHRYLIAQSTRPPHIQAHGKCPGVPAPERSP